jgi:AhpD family alkylhydroperoxidase
VAASDINHREQDAMSGRRSIEYRDASPEVRAVFDDIKHARRVDDVNNFWKYLARDPATLRRTWESVKEVMAPGALDTVTKEMIYLAVSVTNGCAYCIASHGAAARKVGMNEKMRNSSGPIWPSSIEMPVRMGTWTTCTSSSDALSCRS